MPGRFPAYKTLAWACVLGAVAQSVTDYLIAPGALDALLLFDRTDFLRGQIWRAATYAFLHGVPGALALRALHLGFNMLALVMFGRWVESVFGKARFFALFFISAAAGALLQATLPAGGVGLVGASGAVFGVLGAFGRLYPQASLTLFVFLIVPWRVTARGLIATLAATSAACIAFGWYPELGHAAHLGGLIAGWLMVPRRKRASGPPAGPQTSWVPRKEIDRILDKVEREGIHSLTRRERRILSENAN